MSLLFHFFLTQGNPLEVDPDPEPIEYEFGNRRKMELLAWKR